jgi:aminoglycoside phosphotransferase (APT) family kinase protein
MDLTDEATTIRKGEELDRTKIESFLRDSISGLTGEMTIKQFPSGHSNLTYLVTVGDREMVLRRPPFGHKAKTAHDMGREYRILSAIHAVYPYAPRPLTFSDDESIIGCTFYVMQKISGIILRRDLPTGLQFSRDQLRRLFERLVEVLYELHSIDYKSIGLENFGKPGGYVSRQVTGWNKRYRAARTPDVPECEDIMAWLEEKMPTETDRPGLIHNDFKFDNVVLDPNDPIKIIGVLDWEMATLGDPLMDLGCSLGYWVEKSDSSERQAIRSMPTHLDGAMTRQEMVNYYARLSGLQMQNFDFYLCFGLFRLAVIIQQIYYRYYHGQTSDERFKTMSHVVAVLDRAARKVIEQADFL